MQSCDLALHFAARLVQRLILSAHKWTYDVILTNLRILAEIWFEDKPEALKAIDRINKFKKMVMRGASAWEIWDLVKEIEPKAILPLQLEFMDMLKRNLMLEYQLTSPTSEEEAKCLQGEFSIGTTKLFFTEKPVPNPDFWTAKTKWILMSVSTHKQLVVTPIRWEGSMTMVSKSFISIFYKRELKTHFSQKKEEP